SATPAARPRRSRWAAPWVSCPPRATGGWCSPTTRRSTPPRGWPTTAPPRSPTPATAPSTGAGWARPRARTWGPTWSRRRRPPARRVVMPRAGRGEHRTSRIGIRGSTLALYSEPPANTEDAPLTLRLAGLSESPPLVEVEKGGLDVIGGRLVVPDLPGPRAPHVIRVKGGDVRLYRCRLEGALYSTPRPYKSLIALEGSGDPEAARSCAITPSVPLSR